MTTLVYISLNFAQAEPSDVSPHWTNTIASTLVTCCVSWGGLLSLCTECMVCSLAVRVELTSSLCAPTVYAIVISHAVCITYSHLKMATGWWPLYTIYMLFAGILKPGIRWEICSVRSPWVSDDSLWYHTRGIMRISVRLAYILLAPSFLLFLFFQFFTAVIFRVLPR